MVDVQLIVSIGLDISSLSPYRPEVHIQQPCSTVDIKGTCGDAVDGEIGLFGVSLSRTGHHKQHILLADLILQLTDERPDALIQSEVGVFQFQLTF